MKYKLTPFPEDELSKFTADLQEVLDKHGAQLEPEPKFIKNTIQGPEGQSIAIWSQVMTFVVYKKVPNGDVVSPIQDVNSPETA